MAEFKKGDKVRDKPDGIIWELVKHDSGVWLVTSKIGNGLIYDDQLGSEYKKVEEPTEVRVTDPKTGGQKGVKLERYDLLPDDALDEVARVYGEGAKKYEDRNWEKGYKWGYSIGALKRHVSLFCQGHDYDTGPGGTNRHHMACAAWHCLCLLTFSLRHLGTDDRVKYTKQPDEETCNP